jgi:hypothetical protein
MAGQLQHTIDIREIVRERSAAAARGARTGASCCGDDVANSGGGGVFGDALSAGDEVAGSGQVGASRSRT